MSTAERYECTLSCNRLWCSHQLLMLQSKLHQVTAACGTIEAQSGQLPPAPQDAAPQVIGQLEGCSPGLVIIILLSLGSLRCKSCEQPAVRPGGVELTTTDAVGSFARLLQVCDNIQAAGFKRESTASTYYRTMQLPKQGSRHSTCPRNTCWSCRM